MAVILNISLIIIILYLEFRIGALSKLDKRKVK